MRKDLIKVVSLRDNPNKVYGVTVDSLNDFISSLKASLKSRDQERKRTVEYLIYKNNKDEVGEIISDFLHYHVLQDQYLMQYGIIRIIGIFESIIDQGQSNTHKTKPIVVKVKKFLKSFDLTEFEMWVKLRRELVHRPSEHYYPINIEIKDIEELVNIVEGILNKLGFKFNCTEFNNDNPSEESGC